MTKPADLSLRTWVGQVQQAQDIETAVKVVERLDDLLKPDPDRMEEVLGRPVRLAPWGMGQVVEEDGEAWNQVAMAAHQTRLQVKVMVLGRPDLTGDAIQAVAHLDLRGDRAPMARALFRNPALVRVVLGDEHRAEERIYQLLDVELAPDDPVARLDLYRAMGVWQKTQGFDKDSQKARESLRLYAPQVRTRLSNYAERLSNMRSYAPSWHDQRRLYPLPTIIVFWLQWHAIWQDEARKHKFTLADNQALLDLADLLALR